MKEQTDNIDQLFKQKLGEDRHFEIPDSYTEDLQNRLAKRKGGNNKKLYFFILIFVLFGITATAFFMNGFDSSSKNENHSELADPHHSTNNANNNELADISPLNSDNQTDLNSNTENENLKNQVNNNDYSTDKNEVNSNLKSENTTNKNQFNSTKTVKNSTIQNDKLTVDKTEVDKSSILNGNVNSQKSNKVDDKSSIDSNLKIEQNQQKDEKDGEDLTTENSERKTESGTNSSDSDSDSNQEDEKQPDNNLANNNSTNIDSSDTINTDSNIDSLNNTEIDSNLVENDAVDSTLTENTDSDSTANNEINNDPKPKIFSIEPHLYAGIDFGNSKLLANTTTESNTFNSNKKLQTTGHYGAGINFNIKNFYTGLGVSMNKYKDQIDYTTEVYTPYTYDSTFTVSVDSIIYDTLQNPIDTITYTYPDSVQVSGIDTTTSNNSVINEYKMIMIPLTLGYTIKFKNWAIRPQVSGILEIIRATSSSTYPVFSNGTNVPYNLTSTKFGFSFAIETQIQRNLGNFHVYVRPGYRMRFTNVATDGTFSVKYNTFQTVFGVGYYF
ncbi:hypothetical protein K6119_16530 [Paracrocinitomix mangrovi]|uniref:hypothetical protein n=1 Tax=Paracrocinitomix mangrovi TaxID=2862509 RepID=UPI001C8D1EE5|nr:hypothetical protein [Paracrocinitomix mangrovi]UKN01335.1 hypothetical protein K6119_16530 [Paracrocinitomix mangrovi]